MINNDDEHVVSMVEECVTVRLVLPVRVHNALVDINPESKLEGIVEKLVEMHLLLNVMIAADDILED